MGNSVQVSPASPHDLPINSQQHTKHGEEGDFIERLSQNKESLFTVKGLLAAPFLARGLASLLLSDSISTLYSGSEVAVLTQYFTIGAPRFKLQVILWLRVVSVIILML